MGPFVPDPISDQMNLLVAFIIGIAFGMIMEQAGFSSSRRLTGLFYGHDFTVLRVFFTAAITAIFGVTLLDYFGFLDVSLIYVNQLFLWPAIIGGICMGIGFILGGYCPGTSMCALSIGKIDAMMFVGGGLLGVFIYAELTPSLSEFIVSSDRGSVFVYDSLGISKGLFIFLLIVAAVAAFVATSRIEKRINKEAPSFAFPRLAHITAGIVILLVTVVLSTMTNPQEELLAAVADPNYQERHPVELITADETAFRMIDRDPRTVLIDIRPASDYGQSALPGSNNLAITDLFKKEANLLFARQHVQKIIISGDGQDAMNAARIAQKLGFLNIKVLAGGFEEFRKSILTEKSTPVIQTRWENDVVRFRVHARTTILKMMEDAKTKPGATVKKVKKIKGGC